MNFRYNNPVALESKTDKKTCVDHCNFLTQKIAYGGNIPSEQTSLFVLVLMVVVWSVLYFFLPIGNIDYDGCWYDDPRNYNL